VARDRRATLEAFGLGAEDLAAWEAANRPDEEFEDWLMDRVARKPSGSRARAVYGAEEVHDFARSALLEVLRLRPEDSLLEIGSGGGLLLRDALATGARATGIDHSEEMVALASERAPGAEVRLGCAESLPFADESFTAVAISIVFLFFDDPIAVLRECRRVARSGGRLAVYTTAPELRGTPAAPEPLASRGHFYSDDELAALAVQARWDDARVHSEGGGQLLHATKS
jgi:SAM-dependent methyltransferase